MGGRGVLTLDVQFASGLAEMGRELIRIGAVIFKKVDHKMSDVVSLESLKTLFSWAQTESLWIRITVSLSVAGIAFTLTMYLTSPSSIKAVEKAGTSAISIDGINAVSKIGVGSQVAQTISNTFLPQLQLPAEATHLTLSPPQEKLLGLITGYQRQYAADKLIIGRTGTLHFDGDPKKGEEVNLVRDLYGTDDSIHEIDFVRLMESLPTEYLRFFPETRWDNPFVVRVTEAGLKYLQKAAK